MLPIPDKGKIYIPLFLLCALSLLVFLGATPFNTRGEPREAVVAMSMLQDGNWILPVNNGDEIAFKPPLLHWLVAAFSWVAGGVSEFTSRLPSALAATAMVLATFGFFSRRKETMVAMTAALITLTCFEVHRAAMTCRVDMLLAALMVLAAMALYRWGERGLKGIPWWGIVCLAGAALTKGPVGVVLPCAAVALHLLLRGEQRFVTLLWKFFLVFAAALVPLALWYAAAYAQPHGGERFLTLIYEENVLRFTGKMTYASHINPWHYNVMTLFTGLLPYTLVFVCALPLGVAALWRSRPSGWWPALRALRPLAALRRMAPADAFALVTFAVIFVFYCIPASKRSVYLLPLYPFAAYFLARFLLWLGDRHVRTVRAFGVTLAVLTFVLTGAFVAVKCGLVPESIFSGRHAAENVAFLHAIADIPIGLKTVVLAGLPLLLAAGYCYHRRQPRLFLITGLVFALQLCLDGLYLPAIMRVKTDREVAARIAEYVPRGRLYSYRTDVLEANRMHPFTINFYLGDRIIPIDKARPLPAEGYLVAGNEEIADFEKAWPQYAATLVYDSGHRSCDDKKVVRLYHIVRR